MNFYMTVDKIFLSKEIKPGGNNKMLIGRE